jgi:hypothetical protein
MKRVWLSLAVLTLFVVGNGWQSPHVLGQTEETCSAADMASDSHGEHPNLEQMRAYGECPWYFDDYRHGALAEVAEDQAADEAAVGAAVESVQAADPIVLNDADVAVDCWYDCQSDEYYRYEFSHVADEAVASDDVEDTSLHEADTACEEPEYADEYAGHYGDEYADEGFMDCADAAPAAEICREPITVTSEDVATEEAWRSDYDCDYEEYLYGYDDEQDDESADSEPVEAIQDLDSGAGEAVDEAVPPAPASELVQFDSEVLLSVARSLDRLGNSLQALSHYLTEIATTDVAQQGHDKVRR